MQHKHFPESYFPEYKGARVRLTVRMPIKTYRLVHKMRKESVNDFIVWCVERYIEETTEK